MDHIKTWTGLSGEESLRMIEDRDKWRKWTTLGSTTAKEQNTTYRSTCLAPRHSLTHWASDPCCCRGVIIV